MPAADPTLDFESIRPYRDDEVAQVVGRLVRDPWLVQGAARLALPRLHRRVPALARLLAGLRLQQRGRVLHSVAQFQQLIYRYLQRLIRETIVEFQVTGFEHLEGPGPYLFISNHRDIVLDSGLLGVALHEHGHNTSRLAIGDNLFTRPVAADLMRLNKGFVVERSATGTKAVYAAMRRTSNYIRHSLEAGESVWIAQRAGRAKDGLDRTDPALLKMLALAYRDTLDNAGRLPEQVRIVPVSVSYELDPCDWRKARELAMRAATGEYNKLPDEDLRSIVEGLSGEKGRVALHVGPPVTQVCESPEVLSVVLDEAIVGGFRIFPTHVEAARLLGRTVPDSELAPVPAVMTAFAAREQRLPAAQRPYLLAQYANVFEVRRELGLG